MVDADLGALDELLSDDVLYAPFQRLGGHQGVLPGAAASAGRWLYHSLEHATEAVVSRPGVTIVSGTMSGSVGSAGAAKTLDGRVAAVGSSTAAALAA